MKSEETGRYPPSVREVFAWYGAAMHAVQFFEADLITLYITARAWKNDGATLGQMRSWEEAVSRETLGRILKSLGEATSISAEVRETWEEALKARNRLAHNYFWSHFEALSDAGAHGPVISELRAAAHLFNDAARAARDVVEALIPKLGIKVEVWKTSVEEELARLRGMADSGLIDGTPRAPGYSAESERTAVAGCGLAATPEEYRVDPAIRLTWDEFLNPDLTRPRLVAASVYLAGFEALENSIVGRIRDFFGNGFDKNGDRIGSEYRSDVLARNRSPVYASLDWLKEHRALDEQDLQTFERAKACRNLLAHELFSLVAAGGLPAGFHECFSEMSALLRKVEVWWIANVEIPTNPDYDGAEIDEAKIVPGPVVGMQLLMTIALGDDERCRFYYREFRNRTGGGSG
jgi:uncharacterized protein YutE (UPF0331/DUF86 family)